ncbi:hypothetical protein B0H11DRAFT_1931128 [Mycena galericulata]|nr:hypothetical protein B0H11DRAFT_1931128 [Mycena galericulata]
MCIEDEGRTWADAIQAVYSGAHPDAKFQRGCSSCTFKRCQMCRRVPTVVVARPNATVDPRRLLDGPQQLVADPERSVVVVALGSASCAQEETQNCPPLACYPMLRRQILPKEGIDTRRARRAIKAGQDLKKCPPASLVNIGFRRCAYSLLDDRIPQPPNAFLMFRSFYNDAVPCGAQNQQELSKQAGQVWRTLPADSDLRAHFTQAAAKEKERHALQFPGYRRKHRVKEPKKLVIGNAPWKVKVKVLLCIIL